jgi:ParB family transcriptional regulator, chromosome partitioning protein
VFATTDGRYGLISGLRRLTVIRRLAAGSGRPATIPAHIRTPATLADAMTLMVEENDIRADISPWEQAALLLAALDAGLFPTLDAALAALYPSANPSRRTRLRAVADVVGELDSLLAAPETLSLRALLRISAALNQDFGPLIRAALADAAHSAPAQWQALQSVLAEADTARADPTPYPPGRPRRLFHPRPDLTIRRERTPRGWSLHFTGDAASGLLMEDIMDDIDRRYGKV